MDLLSAVRQALILNELSGNIAAAYRFSAAAGGHSGLSFGVTQLDVSNNSAAVKCLQECGFTAGEIADLKEKAGDIKALSAKLKAHADIVAKYDAAQIKECLDHVMTVAKSRGIRFANDEAIIHLADYHNQFNLSVGGKMANNLAGVGRPIMPGDILRVIKDTTWGEKDSDDVERRYNNIARLMGGATV